MAPSASTELPTAARQQLLDIARASIRHGLEETQSLPVDTRGLAGALLWQRGVFVTLTIDSRLRGCIGSMQPEGPLARSVAETAFKAAFRDPRFPALESEEIPGTRIEISVLSSTEPLPAENREHLLQQLVPGVDGLLLQDGRQRATFLPKVWEQLPLAEQFLEQLLHKAGLPADHWSNTLSFQRYYTTSFSEPA